MKKFLSFRVEAEFLLKLKHRLIDRGESLQQFVIRALEKEMDKEEPKKGNKP